MVATLPVAGLTSATAQAQDADISLAPVSVTATRTEKLASEAPASVSVVTEKQIEAKNADRIDQMLSSSMGVFTRGAGDGAPSAWSNQIMLRGMPGYYRTGVMVDGQSLNNGFSGGINTSTIPTDSIQQIEVVPGPFSSLYGGAAMGGVVNIITKSPDKREFILRGGYGSYQTHSEAATYRDRFKFTDSSLGLSLNLDHSASQGYVNDYVTKTASGAGGTAATGWTETTSSTGARAFLTGDKGRVGWYKDNAGLKLHYDWGKDTKVTIEGNHHDSATIFDHSNLYLRGTSGQTLPSGTGANALTLTGAGANISTRTYDYLWSYGGEQANRYRGTFETGIWNDATLKASVGLLNAGYWYVLADQTATDDLGQGKYSDIPNTRTDIDLSLGKPVGGNHYLLGGLFVGMADLDKHDYLMGNWKEVGSQSTSAVYNSNGETFTKAAYFQDEIAVTNAVTMYLGGRYDRWSTSGSVHQKAYSWRGTTYNQLDTTYDERTKGAFSPKASVSYKLDSDSTLRAAIGKAFRAPSLSDMYSGFSTASGYSYSNPDLKPEKSRSWELGGEHTFRDTNTLLKGTYFNTQMKDMLYSYTSGSNTYKANAGGAHIQGFELEARQHLVEKLFAFVNFTVQDSFITNNPAKPNTVGKRATSMPDKMWNIGIEGDYKDLFGSFVVQHVAKTFSSDESLDVAQGVSGAYDPYTIANAKIGWNINDVYSTTFAVNNIFDKEYYESSMMPGRTFFLGLKAKY